MSVHLEEQQFIGPVTVFTCSEIYGAHVRVDEGEVQSVLHKNRLGYVFMHTHLVKLFSLTNNLLKKILYFFTSNL